VVALVGLILLGALVRLALVSNRLPSLLNAIGRAAATVHPPADSRVLTVSSPDLPSGLASGTCVEYNPKKAADRHHTVFIDPGHGGPDPGGVGGGLAEKDVTLAVGLQLRDLLRADGFHVVLSRVTDTAVAKLAGSQVVDGAITVSGSHLDTIARIACANSASAEALVAIHFNAFSDAAAGGSEIFYDDVRDFSPESRRLAGDLDASLQASFGAAGWDVFDRGVLSDADTGASGLTPAANAYGRLMEIGPAQAGWNDHPSKMPGALVEPLFLTAPAEAEVAGSSGGQKAIATGLEQGLLAFFAPPPAASPSP
jgi:N-acetylmuramoyl-L-alanine amidase